MKFSTVALFIAVALVGQSQAAPKYAAGCKRFHVVSGTDTCATVAAQYSITTTQLYSWNGGLHTTCDNLDTGSLVCVSLTGTSTITDGPAASSAVAASSVAASSAAVSSVVSVASSSVPSVSAAVTSATFILATSPISGAPSAASNSNSASASASALASTPSKAPSAGIRETVSTVTVLLVSVAVAGTLFL